MRKANHLPMSKRQLTVIALVFVTLLAALLRLYEIAEQPPISDETMSAFTAENYVEHGLFGPIMPFHPNLRNIILFVSMKAFGTGVLGLRGPSLLMGILSVPLLGLLVAKLTRDRTAATLAAFFLAVDPVHITFSRQAIQEVHTTFFILLGTVFFVAAFDERRRLHTVTWLPLAGIAFGLSLASKWHGVFPLAVCLGLVVASVVAEWKWSRAILAVSSLTLVPVTVYLLTYIPWFRRGHGLAEWLPMQLALYDEMVLHAGYLTSSQLDSRPWHWFIKPLMGYGNFTQIGDHPYVTLAVSNPLVWLLVLPASIYLLRSDRDNAGVNVLQLLFWGSYLPLALASRPIWLLSSVAVMPFAFGLVGRLLGLAVPRSQRGWLLLYLGLVVVVSLLLYPMAIGRGWDFAYLRPFVARFNPHP